HATRCHGQSLLTRNSSRADVDSALKALKPERATDGVWSGSGSFVWSWSLLAIRGGPGRAGPGSVEVTPRGRMERGVRSVRVGGSAGGAAGALQGQRSR